MSSGLYFFNIVLREITKKYISKGSDQGRDKYEEITTSRKI